MLHRELRKSGFKSQLFRTQVSETLAVCSVAGIVSVFASVPSKAEEQVQPPPYEIAGLNIVTVNVVWDDAAVRKALPRGIEPVKGMTGGINIYNTERGYVVGPYSAAYFWVDIEGFDSPEGIKGRWMLAGVYGPQPKTTAAFQASGFPIRSGTSRFESDRRWKTCHWHRERTGLRHRGNQIGARVL